MSWLIVLERDLQIGKLRDMGPTATLEEIEQGPGGAHQDPLQRKARFGHQPVAMVKIAEAESDMGIGAEGEVGPQISRGFNDGTAVTFATRA